VYGAYDHSYLQSNEPNQRTQQPVVTGTSVVALKFKDGVVIAADNLGILVTSPSSLHSTS
jgi:20S proteasome subunit beta 7